MTQHKPAADRAEGRPADRAADDDLYPTEPPTRRAGIATPMHPQVLGGLVGAVGASVFVLVNRTLLPGLWPTVALVLWLLALATFVWASLLRPRVLPDLATPERWAGAVYVLAVVGMVALIAGGGAVLRGTGRADLQPALVALAVGLHFLPFAMAFKAPVFRVLGGTVALVGATGLVLGLLTGATAARAAAVVAGLVMLGVMAADARRD